MSVGMYVGLATGLKGDYFVQCLGRFQQDAFSSYPLQGYFVSTTEDTYTYEFHFKAIPTFVEVYDIHGNGIRGTTLDSDSASATRMPQQPLNSS